MSFIGGSVGSLDTSLGMASSTCVTLAFITATSRESDTRLGTSPATPTAERRAEMREEQIFALEGVPDDHVPKGLLQPSVDSDRDWTFSESGVQSVSAGFSSSSSSSSGGGGGGAPALRSCLKRPKGERSPRQQATRKNVVWSDDVGLQLEERHEYPRAYTAQDFHQPTYGVMDYVKSFVSFISFL
eukprot:TRINITY_DN414_c0_g1_i1.p2 TRINITY_DN414_c0_g1~~TRINITY_DN414_c0_g1_i1.p2  ORF type:complete len:186 (+),score=64.90 TRINITY_DN414_c0_g1_i1:87-644(+)